MTVCPTPAARHERRFQPREVPDAFPGTDPWGGICVPPHCHADVDCALEDRALSYGALCRPQGTGAAWPRGQAEDQFLESQNSHPRDEAKSPKSHTPGKGSAEGAFEGQEPVSTPPRSGEPAAPRSLLGPPFRPPRTPRERGRPWTSRDSWVQPRGQLSAVFPGRDRPFPSPGGKFGKVSGLFRPLTKVDRKGEVTSGCQTKL